MRNGTDKPIEIYNLAMDVGEKNDLAEAKPELVARAGKIFAESHRPDPHWPLDRLSDALNQSRKQGMGNHHRTQKSPMATGKEHTFRTVKTASF